MEASTHPPPTTPKSDSLASMGGQAFAAAGPDGSPLAVPRMSPDTYKEIAAQVHSKLVTVFRNVTIPRDTPGKQDFGDVDFLVEGSLAPWTTSTIKELIGATHHIPNGSSNSYAVPYATSPEQFMQVDVEICPGNDTPEGPDLFEWTRFFKSYSDLFQIIGICHRDSLGITCNDRGLHIRVKEIEPYHRRKSQLFLTRDPDKTMEFFGFDSHQYWAGFSSEGELFEWVVRGRFFSMETYAAREESNNDRSRHKKRPMYRRFVDEFLPAHTPAGEQETTWTREQVLEKALQMFDKREEYESMMREHNLREREIAMWERVRDTLPVQGKSGLVLAVKSLRRWVDFSEGQPFITAEAMIDNQPVWSEVVKNEESVLSWIKDHWQEIRALEKARAKIAREAATDSTATDLSIKHSIAVEIIAQDGSATDTVKMDNTVIVRKDSTAETITKDSIAFEIIPPRATMCS